MVKRISLFIGLAALFATGSAQAAVCPGGLVRVNAGTNDDTGHVFEVYKANTITWEQAQACVDALPSIGTPPNETKAHLATITSSSENEWIVEVLLNPALTLSTTVPNPLDSSQVWVGGVQDKTGIPLPGVGDGWRWVNNEGPISGSNGNIDYTNWAGGEPNDNGGAAGEDGSEDHLTIGRFSGADLGKWNDEGSAPTSIGGFIVEYDTPRTAAECTGGPDSAETCTTIDGQTLTFPPETFEAGDTVQFTAYEFNDPRVAAGTCGSDSLPPLFTDPVFNAPDDGNPLTDESRPLKIPPYLCGSPKFVVVKVDSEDLTIQKGAVLVENETETVLPDNLYKCSDPILGNLDTGTDPDPQYQDVVVWQSTDPTKMLENQFGTGVYLGAATEATNGCGSTRAKVRGASYFVVGMHVDFNLGISYPANATQNYLQFVALSRHKLTLLRESIAAARSAGSLRPVVSTAMDALIALAIYRLDKGNPAGALIQVRQFLWLVNSARYTAIANQNFNGDHLMRGENIAFTLRVKVIPYKPVP